MAKVPLYPLRFKPILRQLIWGGRRLGTILHKPIGEASDILALGTDRIIGIGRPVGVAMAALIECQTVKLVAQREAAQIPGMRSQGAAVQKEDRPQPFGSPIEVTESQLAHAHIVLARQNDVAEGKARAYRGGLQMIVIFVGG